jgi:glycosyltransferase involved in cell wall biosynthesis
MSVHLPEIVFILFCSITAVQVFYYLYFFSRLAFYKKPRRESSMQHAVSVIVCARDEAQNLADNLPYVLQQEYKSTFEVVAVNDNSFDDSKYVLEYLAKPFRNLRPVELKQEARFIQGKKFPLSMGIKEAKHELLLLTDADCKPASHKWIELMQDAFSNGKEIALGYGAYYKKPGILNKLIRFETFLSALQYFSYALAGIPYMGVGRNLAYRKELFFRNKGFSSHNQLPGGDDDLFINKVATAANTAIVIDANAFTFSEPETTWRNWQKQKSRHYTTSKHYKPKHQWLLGMYAFSHLLFYPLLLMAAVLYSWWLALVVFAVRLLVQGIVYNRSMQQLNEKDLFWFFPLLDLWQWFYYLLFAPSLVKKPDNNWK